MLLDQDEYVHEIQQDRHGQHVRLCHMLMSTLLLFVRVYLVIVYTPRVMQQCVGPTICSFVTNSEGQSFYPHPGRPTWVTMTEDKI